MNGNESSENSNKDILSIVNNSECPNPDVIQRIRELKEAYIKLDVTSLMIKAYMLGFHNGHHDRN